MKRVGFLTLIIGLALALTLTAAAADDGRPGEEYLLEQVNHERLAQGRAPLALNSELTLLAREKARDMAQNRYFDHVSPALGTVYEMLEGIGYSYKWAGENIARVSSVEVAHRALMESPGHRANILSAGYTEVGIGVYEHQGNVYVCQIFSRPRP